jgi:peptidoglycan/LPS O-acetylase OafA/YrhL
MSDPTVDRPRIAYVPALDGLRGVAVAVVVLFHVGHLRGGYLGVDLFFVLSGFLITSLLLVEGRGSGKVALARFWERRARRLLPALGVMLVGVAAYARFAAQPDELNRIRWDGVATLLYVANWRDVFAKSDYWALFRAPSPLEHTWSLAIEEQFYLVWPLVFVAMLALVRWRRGRDGGWSLSSVVLVVSGLLGVLSLVATAVFQRVDGWNRVYYGTDTRAFAILAGAMVAAATSRSAAPMVGMRRWAADAAGLVGALGLGASWVFLAGGTWTVQHGGLAACSIAGALVIGAVANAPGGLVARVFACAPLRWLGLISYGVYLYHWPLIVWLDADRVHLHGWPLIGVQVAVTLVVSVVSYVVIEQPVRHGALRTNLLVPATGFAAVAVVVVAATVGYRSPAESVQGTPQPTVPAQAGGKRIMVIGNSVAYFLAAEGMAKLRSSPQFGFRNDAQIACSYPGSDSFYQHDGTFSTAFIFTCDNGWKAKATAYRPDYVIYTRNELHAYRVHHEGKYIDTCSAAFHDWYVSLLVADARAFAAVGAKLVLVTTFPHAREPNYFEPWDLSVASAWCNNDVLHDVAKRLPDEVQLIDIAARFCTREGDCRKRLDGAVLQADGGHFRGAGAVVMARLILEQMGIEAQPSG